MERAAQYLAHQLVSSKEIEAEDLEVYAYGIQLILSSAFTSGFIIVLGVLLGKWYVSILFLMALAGLRHYSGGYHAKTYLKCFMVSCTLFVITLGMTCITLESVLQYTLVGLSLISMCYLCKIGSLNSVKNPKTDKEMQLRRFVTRLLSVFYSLLSISLLFVLRNYTELAVVLICAQFFTAGSVLILKREEGK